MTMNTVFLSHKLRRLILLRLLIVAFSLTLGAILFSMNPVLYYSVLSATLGMSLIYAFWLKTARALGVLTYLQLLVDLFAISIMVHYTGGVDSALATLYVLVIVAAGFLLFPDAPVWVAAAGSVFFVSVVVLDCLGWTPSFIPEVQKTFVSDRDWLYCAYMTYVRVTIFMLVGFLSRHLVRAIDQMEKNMRVKEKFAMLGEIAMHLAHEIKNPLMSISGSIEVLSDEMKGRLSRDDEKLMEAIVKESERLKNLFEKVADFTRSEKLDFRKIDVNQILDEVLLLLEPSLNNGRHFDIKRDYQEAAKSLVYADRDRIKQVFINVIYNALDAMPQGGALTVKTKQTEGETRILVNDTGVGMDRRTLEELFIPFKSHKRGGTGIGLAIAYKIVKLHGGKIKVTSKPSRGSTFIISLPRG